MRVAISNPVVTKSFVACQLEDNCIVAGEEPPEMWLSVAVRPHTTTFARHPVDCSLLLMRPVAQICCCDMLLDEVSILGQRKQHSWLHCPSHDTP